MTNQVGSSRVDTVLKMLLIAFISLFAFSSGVFFGKQMSDSDYKLKALESDFNHTTKTASEHAKDADATADALMDDEVASLSDKFVNDQRDELADAPPAELLKENPKSAPKEVAKATKAAHANKEEGRKIASSEPKAAEKAETALSDEAVTTKHSAPTSKATAANATNKPDLSAAHKAATRVANNATPTEEAPAKAAVNPQRAPSALPRTVGTQGEVEFTVQIASYPTADAAKAHATELVKKGFPAFPVEAAVGGKTWYRVSVGSFKSKSEATTYRAQLMKQADLQSAIVQRIQR